MGQDLANRMMIWVRVTSAVQMDEWLPKGPPPSPVEYAGYHTIPPDSDGLNYYICSPNKIGVCGYRLLSDKPFEYHISHGVPL